MIEERRVKMAGFCGNCGAPVEDGANVCGNCGTPIARVKNVNVNVGNQVYQNYKQVKAMAKKPADLKKYIPIAAAVLATVVIFIVAGAIISANTGYKKTVKEYFKALNESDEKEAASLISESYTELIGYDNVEEQLENSLDELEDEYGKYKITYKYKDVKKLGKSELKDYKESLDILLDGVKTDYEVDDIKAAYSVEIRYDVKGKEGKKHDNVYFVVIKENGKWKVSDSIL